MAERLSERELDARCGLLAGTVVIAASQSHKDISRPYIITGIAVRREAGGLTPDRPNVEHRYLVPHGVPCYSTNLNAARELEDEIERRGLQEQYEAHLRYLVRAERETWNMIHATARQRAEAFVRVMEGARA